MKVKSESEVAQSCPTPSDPMDCSLPGSSAHGILQARLLEWGAIAFSIYAQYMMWNARLDEAQAGNKIAKRNINNLRYADDNTLMAESEEELKRLLMKVKSESEVAQSCPTLRDPMDCSLPGSSAHGILQARVLEWGAIAFSTQGRERVKSLW